MSRGIFRLCSWLVAAFVSVASANTLDFSIIKKEQATVPDNTLLVIGGIQGDEPGGFLAASILSTEYEITKGSVWIVPNLNFESIIKRSRGVSGDMNRKFAYLRSSDPDFKAITNIKELITHPSVALIVNLHDGSGFFRHTYIDKYFNPQRWGNSCIIDQKKLEGVKYGELDTIAERVAKSINEHLEHQKHKYHVRNTHTREGDQEMLKSLTYFAINQGKAAFANEASKSLMSHERAYYHLLALEEYMNVMGIEFKRTFPLNMEGVKGVINKEIEISLFDKKVYLNLNNPRSIIKYVPMPKQQEITYEASNPLTAVVKDDHGYSVHYGNRQLTKLIPQYFDYTEDKRSLKVNVDGEIKEIALGSLIKVNDFFNVEPTNDMRINVIGYVNNKYKDESGLNIRKQYVLRHYSIDKTGKTFRVEVYDQNKEEKYAGMFLVEFSRLNDEVSPVNIADTETSEIPPLQTVGR